MKKKKENLKLCMIYHCKECPRARKCEEEQKRYEKNVKNNNQFNIRLFYRNGKLLITSNKNGKQKKSKDRGNIKKR